MASKSYLSLSLLLLITLATSQTTNAVDYSITNTAPNTAGGVRFTNEIGADYVRETLPKSTDFIWNIFQQTNDADRKPVTTVSVFIDDMDGVAYASNNNEIHVSAKYIGSYSDDVKREITGVIYHEMTHIWQWNGNGQAPGGLIEGFADYVRLKSGNAPSHWVKDGEGTKWDQGYDVTARFLDYIEGVRPGFVAELNKKMRSAYSDGYFADLTGKNVDQLWREYKARFGNLRRRF